MVRGVTHTLDADLDEILTFTQVVQAGSFTAAAKRMGAPKSTVSRKILELEARVGARLLQRTTRTLSLTDLGQVYYAHCLRIVAEVEDAQRALAQRAAAPRGTLRVTAPVALAPLGPVLAALLARYPELQLELVCTDRRVDLVDERFDLAIRMGEGPDSSLIARKLGAVRKSLWASPRWIAQAGALDHPRALERHPGLVFAPEGATWRLVAGARTAEVKLTPRIAANDYEMLRAMALADLGVALLPDFLCAEGLEQGALARVLPAWSSREVPVYALYPSARLLSPGVAALLDLLRERLALGRAP